MRSPSQSITTTRLRRSLSSGAQITSFGSNTCLYHWRNIEVTGYEKWNADPSTMASGDGSRMLIANCVVTNWKDYGFFVHQSDLDKYLNFIGVRAQQNVDALHGNPALGKVGLYNDHGPFRVDRIRNFSMSQCDVFSRNGWSGITPGNADQPCLRLNSKPTGPENKAIVDRCVMEGGWRVIAIEGQNPIEAEYPGNYLIDKALLIASSKTVQNFVFCEFGGTTVRNTIGILPNVPEYHTSNSWAGGIRLSYNNGADAANTDTPVQIYNNTFVNLRNAANDDGDTWVVADMASAFNNLTEENNIAYAPNIDTPVDADGQTDIAATLPGVTPRNKGIRSGFGFETGTLGSDVANGGSFTLTYPAGTDQAYWTGLSDTGHIINGVGTWYADLAEFSVAFNTSDITITNTSGEIWENGRNWRLKLDRSSQIPAMDTTFATPSTVPMPRSSAVGSGDLGLSAYDDFLGQPRPQTGDTRGALLPE